jgi:hypothetical protein
VRKKIFFVAVTTALLVFQSLRGATAPESALIGRVSSAEEGSMEGVLVSAKKAGSTITVTVVSDAQGRYSFPAARIAPGEYALSIRAAGYDLDGSDVAIVTAGKTAEIDLKLRKASDLAAQLTNADWIASVPGSQQQKSTLLSCVGCHTIERIARSKYDTEGFMTTLKRMSGYANQSTPIHPQLRLGERDTAAELNKANTQINMTSPMSYAVDGKLWSQNNGFAGVHRIDLKSGKWETWDPFKENPRGHNIYDVIADSRNNGYFTDIGREHIGKIDAKTGKLTLYQTPTMGSGPRRGMMDAQDRLWFGEYRGNKIGMFDTKGETFKEWTLPTAWSNPYDVTVDKNDEAWTGSMLNDRITRLNSKTGEFTEYLLPKTTNVRRVFVDNSTTPVTFWVGSNHGASIIKLEPLE